MENPDWHGQFSTQNLQALGKYISPDSMWWIRPAQAAPADTGAILGMLFPFILYRCTFDTCNQHPTSPVVLPCAELLGRPLPNMAPVPPTHLPPCPPLRLLLRPPFRPPHLTPRPPHCRQFLPIKMPLITTATLVWTKTRETTKHRASRASLPNVRSSNLRIPRGGRPLSSGNAWWRPLRMSRKMMHLPIRPPLCTLWTTEIR